MEQGTVVRSMRGHDKDRFYVVMAAEPGKVYIADGKRRKRDKPKAKNEKHVARTNTVVDLADYPTDKSLRRLLGPMNEAAGLTKGG